MEHGPVHARQAPQSHLQASQKLGETGSWRKLEYIAMKPLHFLLEDGMEMAV